MPEHKTLERARKDKAQGKSPSTQAGEFVKEQVAHLHDGNGPRAPKSHEQAVAIGLSEARRAGVHIPKPSGGK